MEKHEIYFARVIDQEAQSGDTMERRYAFCHVLPWGGGRCGSGMPLEYLAGYLDGTTLARWNEFRVFGGMPTRVATRHFEDLELKPLDANTVRKLYALADLSERDVLIETVY